MQEEGTEGGEDQVGRVMDFCTRCELSSVTDGKHGRIFRVQRGYTCVLGQSLRCSMLNSALGMVTEESQRKHIRILPMGGSGRNLVTESENIYIYKY